MSPLFGHGYRLSLPGERLASGQTRHTTQPGQCRRSSSVLLVIFYRLLDRAWTERTRTLTAHIRAKIVPATHREVVHVMLPGLFFALSRCRGRGSTNQA